jgi:hypothetical protein
LLLPGEAFLGSEVDCIDFLMIFFFPGNEKHYRRHDPAHNLQRVLADGAWEGCYAEIRPHLGERRET